MATSTLALTLAQLPRGPGGEPGNVGRGGGAPCVLVAWALGDRGAAPLPTRRAQLGSGWTGSGLEVGEALEAAGQTARWGCLWTRKRCLVTGFSRPDQKVLL